MNKVISTLAALALMAGAANAQSLAAAGVQLSYGINNGDYDSTSIRYEAFGAFEVFSGVVIQAGINGENLAYDSSNKYSDFGYDVHLVATQLVNGQIGVFYSSTGMWGGNYNNVAYGIEYATEFNGIGLEFQAGAFQAYEADSYFVSANGEYGYGDFTFRGGLTYIESDFGDQVTAVSVGAGYNIPGYGMELFADYTNYTTNSPYAGDFFEVGVSIPFGAGSYQAFSNPGLMSRVMHLVYD